MISLNRNIDIGYDSFTWESKTCDISRCRRISRNWGACPRSETRSPFVIQNWKPHCSTSTETSLIRHCVEQKSTYPPQLGSMWHVAFRSIWELESRLNDLWRTRQAMYAVELSGGGPQNLWRSTETALLIILLRASHAKHAHHHMRPREKMCMLPESFLVWSLAWFTVILLKTTDHEKSGR